MARPTAEEIQDMRDAPKLEKAYNKSMRNTPANPEPKPKPEPSENVPKATKFAKGGMASSRADGIAQRGKTRGKMC